MICSKGSCLLVIFRNSLCSEYKKEWIKVDFNRILLGCFSKAIDIGMLASCEKLSK